MCLSRLIYTVQPCLIHTCHTMHVPRPCHALTMPFLSRPRHITAVERGPVGYLPAFGFFRLPCGLSRRTQHCRRMAGARHGMCELTERHGRGTAWARHAICESTFREKNAFPTCHGKYLVSPHKNHPLPSNGRNIILKAPS
jgi:hypothetical protein